MSTVHCKLSACIGLTMGQLLMTPKDNENQAEHPKGREGPPKGAHRIRSPSLAIHFTRSRSSSSDTAASLASFSLSDRFNWNSLSASFICFYLSANEFRLRFARMSAQIQTNTLQCTCADLQATAQPVQLCSER